LFPTLRGPQRIDHKGGMIDGCGQTSRFKSSFPRIE
jgi:hypothetical protein